MKTRALWLLVCVGNALETGPIVSQSLSAQDESTWQTLAEPELSWIDHSDGLSNNSVFDILQDHQGFLWFGTIDGLNRYDGHEFEIFRHDPADSASLSNSTIRRLFEDSQRRLWLRTGTGVDRFDRATGTFRRYPETVQQFLEDRSGRIWITSLEGLHTYEAEADSFVLVTKYKTRDETPARLAWGLAQDSAGLFWVVHADGQLNAYTATGEVTHTSTLPWEETAFLGGGGPGRIWVGHKRGVGAIQPVASGAEAVEEEPSVFSRDDSHVLSALQDRAGRTWLGGSGLFRAEPGEAFELLWSDEDRGGLNTVWSIVEDREGTVWAATLRGVLRFDAYPRLFGHTRTALEPDRLHPAGPAMALAETSDGSLWLGTLATGLFRVDNGARSMRRVLPDASWIRDVWDIHPAFDEIWLGTNQGLTAVDPRRETARRVTLPVPAGALQPIVFTIADAGGRIWVGGPGGLHWVEPRTGEAGQIDLSARTRGESVRIEALQPAADGELWVFTSDSDLYIVDLESLRVRGHNSGEPAAFRGSEGVWAVATDRRGRVWTGSDRGLGLFDESAGEIRLLGPREGFPSTTVYAILDDPAGAFWLSTDVGLLRLAEPTTYPSAPLDLRLYRLGVDLLETEFNRRAALRGTSHTLFFGGTDGVTFFEPANILDNPYAPPVSIKQVERIRQGGSVHVYPFGQTSIELSHEDAGFEIAFSAPSFAGAENVQYSAFLEGSDVTWFNPGSQGRVRYMGVPPGEYTFRIRAASPDGVWNDVGASLGIRIPPPFWDTTWFRALAGTLLLASLVLGVRAVSTRRLRQQVAGLELERGIQEERNRISRDLHDHVGSHVSNILSGIELARLSVSSGRPDRVADHLRDLDQDARRTLTELRETAWSLHQEHMTVAVFGDRIEDYLERRQRYLTSPALTLHTIGDVERELTPVQALNLFRIVQEAVSNAIRHADATNVRVTVESVDAEFAVRVVDDGTFRETDSDAQSGLGIPGMKNRMSEIAGTLSLEHDLGGTTVQARL